jgi:methyltransferase
VVNVVAFVTAVALGLMLAEARLSGLNERALRARGALAPPGDLYRIVAVAYPACLLAMGAEGVWRAWQPVATAGDQPAWFASGALLFVASKGLKYWAIRALGERWTFRVLLLPGVPFATTGPYRYVAHPNYIAVIGELAGTAMMCGARISGPVCVVAYGVVLWLRARFEERAAAGSRRSSEGNRET